ncbi:MAG TPA: transketolase [Alphaproteobacteria bacterium]|nr:transketolase [Alphaproteobacteria bacterium]
MEAANPVSKPHAPAGDAAAVPHAQLANAIRALAMDAVEAAKSGHPGMPMGMADVATVLFTRHLNFDPSHPDWPDRDRFVLSAGHGSMLLYALLYLTGYEDMTLEQLRDFRQLGARTAGHPEYGHASGIETTTGPLGQGLANAVGMALAERLLAERFGAAAVDHHTYVIAGDGCLMEGISHEAISLAGHLKLDRLVVLFDDNSISIDGPTDLSVTDDQLARFAACGWAVRAVDGHDPEAVDQAIAAAKTEDAPSLIACRTTIAYGAPTKAGTSGAHGSPLGADEIAGTRSALGWPHAPFEVPGDILAAWRAAGGRGARARANWQSRIAALDDETRGEFERLLSGRLPEEFGEAIAAVKRAAAGDKPKQATRISSGKTLDALAAVMPELVGGSADLTGSNNTKASSEAVVTPGSFPLPAYVYYGVREHAMAAVMNGLALHKGVVPYGGTFLVFTDYARPSIRLSALMGLRVVYVMTHDSIGLGEDGPTHQPVEHLAALRAIPNLNVFRPADASETAECWALALENTGTPSVLALTRQGLPEQRDAYTEENRCARGAYVLAEAEGARAVTLIATGSEVEIAMQARQALQAEGVATAVISMPCWDLFEAQDEAYQAAVLGAAGGVRVAVEAAIGFGWERWIGANGAFVGMKSFGASAPADELYEHFGITAEAVVAAAKERLG